MTTTLTIPNFSLVLLIGASGSGKSTFAAKHFLPTEVLSSDRLRGVVSDDENSLEATNDAFDALHYLAAIRLRRRKLVVVDATNVQPDSRKPLLKLAADHDALAAAIVLNLPERVCQDRNRTRPERDFGPHVVRNQTRSLRHSLRDLRREGFRYVYVLDENRIDAAQIERTPLWTDRSTDHGPFDIIGDVHGCCDELVELLGLLGYVADDGRSTMDDVQAHEEPDPAWTPGSGIDQAVPGHRHAAPHRPSSIVDRHPSEDHRPSSIVHRPTANHRPSPIVYRHPEGRKAVFLGDLVDRGPKVVETARLVMEMVEAGQALCVPGNHDIKLMRCLQGKRVQMTHGLPDTVAQIESLPEDGREDFRQEFVKFVDGMVSHYLLNDGKLVVAHAGMIESYQGRASGRVREFAIWGDTTGETDEFGLPIRYPWATEYRGSALVVYGHTPVPEAEWLNRTINIDTGCVFGGKLTALRYPEREFVQVPAKQLYAIPARPFLPDDGPLTMDDQGSAPSIVHRLSSPLRSSDDDLLDAKDVLGKHIINTRLAGNVIVKAENSAAAFEVMSRFAVEPRWLIYLPPTMSPCETSSEPGYLEYPAEAFSYYYEQGIGSVVCQTKHMGSRAIIVICRGEQAAFKRFGARNAIGECYTRTGRRFFEDESLHRSFLQEACGAFEGSGLWDELETDWACIDCELMPWNAKAQGLLRNQYAPVGAAAKLALTAAVEVTRKAMVRGIGLGGLDESLERRLTDAELFTQAYGHYCWDVAGLGGLRVAPFHLLATESKTYFDRNHDWHVSTLARLVEASQVFMQTENRSVGLLEASSQAAAVDWWIDYTGSGGEGMVVKPKDFVVRGSHGLVQPAIKVRGRDYLRIIYGPEYTEPDNISRLRSRALGRKRGLAAREFALGVEGLERFVRHEPLRSVHECAFAVLALESEPVDPRL